VINDGPVHPSNRPTIVFGNRGVTLVRLTVFGPKNPLHSGHFGNYAPNPAQRLAALLASMKDDDGCVTIAGYYDGVKLSETERRLLAEVPDDQTELRKRIGTARPEAVGGNYQEALQYPSLNIRGMASAAIGDEAANIVPSGATAEIDLRTTPGADPDYLVSAIEAHIRGRGYHLVQTAPTDEERATYDKADRFTGRHLGSGHAGQDFHRPDRAGEDCSHPDDGRQRPDRQAGGGPRIAVRDRSSRQRRQQPAQFRREPPPRPISRWHPRLHGTVARTVRVDSIQPIRRMDFAPVLRCYQST